MTKPITIAIFEIDDQAKEVVLASGGRVQIATTAVNGAEDYSVAQSVYLVTLPANADVSKATYHGYWHLSLFPLKNVEEIFQLCLEPRKMSLMWVDRVEDGHVAWESEAEQGGNNG